MRAGTRARRDRTRARWRRGAAAVVAVSALVVAGCGSSGDESGAPAAVQIGPEEWAEIQAERARCPKPQVAVDGESFTITSSDGAASVSGSALAGWSVEPNTDLDSCLLFGVVVRSPDGGSASVEIRELGGLDLVAHEQRYHERLNVVPDDNGDPIVLERGDPFFFQVDSVEERSLADGRLAVLTMGTGDPGDADRESVHERHAIEAGDHKVIVRTASFDPEDVPADRAVVDAVLASLVVTP